MTQTSIHVSRQPSVLPWLGMGTLLLLWGGLIISLAEADAFRQTPGLPPIRVIGAIVVPVLAGITLWRFSPRFRAWTETWDLGALVAMQTFRVAGAVFLFFWWIGSLPMIFAWVAALGDIAVGVFAVGTTLAVSRQSAGWKDSVKRLTVFGIADFATVLVTATLSAEGRLLHFAGQPLPSAMQAMPMIMIPGFLVPIFILLLLLQWQRVRG
jgi:hypothetical protein